MKLERIQHHHGIIEVPRAARSTRAMGATDSKPAAVGLGRPSSDPDATTPLLGPDGDVLGMDSCCYLFPVKPVAFGFDTADCVARPIFTLLIQYCVQYLVDYYHDACTKAGQGLFAVLLLTLEVAGLLAIWYNADASAAFPPTLTWINRFQTLSGRPRGVREFWSFLFLCLYLMVLMLLVLIAYACAIYYFQNEGVDLFDFDC